MDDASAERGRTGSARGIADDAGLKTTVVETLERRGTLTFLELGHATATDVHALRFALKRLRRAGVVVAAGTGSNERWQLAQRGSDSRAAALPRDDRQSPDTDEDPSMQILDTEDEETRDDELEEDTELEEDLSAPPRRTRHEIPMFKRGHRQEAPAAKTKNVVGQKSPWERPREGFTEAMGQRAAATGQKANWRDVKPATERF